MLFRSDRLALPSHRDLLDAPGVLALSTLTPAGAIQTTAVWYLLDDDGTIVVSANGERAKVGYLQQSPTVNAFIIDPANPFRTLEIRGTATVTADEDFSMRARVGAKYGTDMSTFDAPGATRWTIRISPDKVVTH